MKQKKKNDRRGQRIEMKKGATKTPKEK